MLNRARSIAFWSFIALTFGMNFLDQKTASWVFLFLAGIMYLWEQLHRRAARRRHLAEWYASEQG